MTRTSKLVALAAAVLALSACGSSTKAPAAAAPISTPSPTPTHLDERAACQLLTPTLQDATTVIKDFIAKPDGSTVDKSTLSQVILTMQQVQQNGPPDLQSKLTDVLKPLVDLQTAFTTGANQQIQTLQFSLVAGSIQDACQPYAG